MLCAALTSWLVFLRMGVLGAGGSDVLYAAMSDLFGSRPILSSKMQTCEGMVYDCSGLVAPFVGAVIAARSQVAGFFATAVVGGALLAVCGTIPETLAIEDRKPFKLLQANPLAHLHLTFTSGPGLRRLAIAATLQQCMQSLHNTIPTYLMGVLGCSTAEVSYIGVASSVGMLGCQLNFVGPTLDRFGLFKTYKIGLFGGALALLLQGNAHRGGGGHMRLVLQWLVAQAVEDLLYEMCWHT